MHRRTENYEKAVEFAEGWLKQANLLTTKKEKSFQQMIQTMLNHESDKTLLIELIDQSFRTSDYGRAAEQIAFTIEKYGIAHFFSDTEKLLVRLFMLFGKHLPALSVPQIIQRIREETSAVIIPGEEDKLKAYLQLRKSEAISTNINYIGEALLGEDEARDRIELYKRALEKDYIAYISIKISTIYSQISTLAFEQTVDVLCERLTEIYRVAQNNLYMTNDQVRKAKFVNLDMEEYRDLHLTLEAFKKTLDQAEFKTHYAGIVLQAYLPDSLQCLIDLTRWAQKRVENGGSPIKIRIVKGANMEMEKIEASLKGWPQTPYSKKVETDANFKRMIEFALDPNHASCVHLGIGSHNLFDIAYAKVLAQANNSEQYVTFEMLEGMAGAYGKALNNSENDLLLYTPVATEEQFINAIAYLVRRLDENTAPANFLRHSFDLKVHSKKWHYLLNTFRLSVQSIDTVPLNPFRTQNRLLDKYEIHNSSYYTHCFINEADTDWSLEVNREWATKILKKWHALSQKPLAVSPVIAGERFNGENIALQKKYDKSLPEKLIGTYHLADEALILSAFNLAHLDNKSWRSTGFDDRAKLMASVAQELKRKRNDLIGIAMAETGKTMEECDAEVSEAIDFAEYYPYVSKELMDKEHLQISAKGVGLVISPWNFPVAIPAGGIIASLIGGNTTLLKPATASVLTAHLLCECFWNAGIPKEALMFLPASGNVLGKCLKDTSLVDFIILTGGTSTAEALLKTNVNIPLSAETGGKNATIVTAISDRDQAIKNVVRSAFGNVGQKCSATSLLILEREVYEDFKFKHSLVDAVRSLKVGSAWDLSTKLGPMANKPSQDIIKAINELEHNEQWALKPRIDEDNPYLVYPGIKWGVEKGNHAFKTELFGPILSVVCAEDLNDAIALANDSDYGLTSGLESLDEREIERWKDQIHAGNLYVNKPTTGAIVQRQPFGGLGKSAFGSGLKAGGPNYVLQFMNIQSKECAPTPAYFNLDYVIQDLLADLSRLDAENLFFEELLELVPVVINFYYEFDKRFANPVDFSSIRGEDNHLKYNPAGKIVLRVSEKDLLTTVIGRMFAAKICNVDLTLSISGKLSAEYKFFIKSAGVLISSKTLIVEEEEDFYDKISADCSRLIGTGNMVLDAETLIDLKLKGIHVIQRDMIKDGQIELLHFLREQSISHSFHRHGNLGERKKDYLES